MAVVRGVVARPGIVTGRVQDDGQMWAAIHLSVWRLDDDDLQIERLLVRLHDEPGRLRELEQRAPIGGLVEFQGSIGPYVFRCAATDEPYFSFPSDDPELLAADAAQPQPRFSNRDPIAALDVFASFAEWWFEFDDRLRKFVDTDIDAMLDGLNVEVPATLRHFYKIAKTWPFTSMFHWNQNLLRSPDTLGTSSLFAEHGLLNFANENQGVTWWACPPGGTDPPVYSRESEDDLGVDPHPYTAGRCSLSLADFLIGYFLFEFSVHATNSEFLTPFDAHFDAHPEEFDLLHDNGLGSRVEFWLWDHEILVMRSHLYNHRTGEQEIRLQPSARTAGELGRLRRFAGHFAGFILRWESGSAEKPLRLSLSFEDGGRGVLAGWGAESRYKHRFDFNQSLAELYAELTPGIGPERDDRSLPVVHVRQEGKQLLSEADLLPSGIVNPSTIEALLDIALDAIMSPSDNLIEDLPLTPR